MESNPDFAKQIAVLEVIESMDPILSKQLVKSSEVDPKSKIGELWVGVEFTDTQINHYRAANYAVEKVTGICFEYYTRLAIKEDYQI